MRSHTVRENKRFRTANKAGCTSKNVRYIRIEDSVAASCDSTISCTTWCTHNFLHHLVHKSYNQNCHQHHLMHYNQATQLPMQMKQAPLKNACFYCPSAGSLLLCLESFKQNCSIATNTQRPACQLKEFYVFANAVWGVNLQFIGAGFFIRWSTIIFIWLSSCLACLSGAQRITSMQMSLRSAETPNFSRLGKGQEI